ncbi:ComEC/Rec2 family competence protein [Candidatus Mycolicibacterium alkanivorans]|uniref:ComEC/Rec2 family competence protein n=1 Tax=Candidatus Mycolicibacterium alkanivorans TaxID=2954114 RepID=A0ABS9YVG6_9MYCO|nr:ComEC/Rec2 family competence protein [Candidatus Mycolicibacterium alkanivorans]MCI4675235.1 ComEC/Rec2 family competence protein [Candidatus Mycolicibacterium alkanivorans]
MHPEAAARLDLRLVPAAVTAWTVTAAGIAWSIGALLAAACGIAAVGWAALVWWRGELNPAIRAAAVAVIGTAVIGAGFGVAVALRGAAVREHPIAHRFGSAASLTVTPTESPRSLGNGRMMFRANLNRVGEDGMSGRVVVFAPVLGFAELTAGQPARFRARIARPTRRDLTVAVITATGEPALGEASAVQRAAQSVRSRFTATALDVLPADQAAMLPGLVLGDTSSVPPATTAQFRTAGLTHLTAVSGANVTIVCGAVLLSARLIGPRPAVALAAVALLVFVIVVQPTASVLRAAVMGALALLAVLSGRRRQAIPILSAAVLALLVAAPQLAVDAGFALSVFATAALVVLAPIWSARLVARGCPKPLADAICVALAAQLVTAPLVAAISGRLSLVAILANLAAAVVIPPITVLGTAAAALCPLWPAGAGLLIRFTGPELWWLLHVARWAGAVPGAAVTVPSGLAGVATVGGTSVLAVAVVVGVGVCRRGVKRSGRERDGGRSASDPR